MKFVLSVIMGAVMFFQLGVMAPATAGAVSLWSDDARNFFSDRRAGQVGDLVTIIINERASMTSTKDSNNSKNGNQNLSAGVGIFDFLAAASASQNDSFSAKGSATNSNTASGTVTVTVVDVAPNGNLIIEGTQSIWNNKNEHKITLQGIIRPEDISYLNTVPSSKVAEATLKFDGKGPLNAKQRQGIITQIFNFLF
ncbi:flagellar basal body L-ring protein FlgH [uncultured Anaerovibrio sp.]|uniref:flagellar basal body L-ring protein FlgH n=1 Tax=uncultured Anaerovibrio sp. TaxID=361586 RepID=UPI00261402D7|nr:flagellar basal body L-ring protein FlgH [uncultured Anaerovibrio sp.]